MSQASESDLMTIEVYQEDGKWAWQCLNVDDLPVCGGFGYRSEAEAEAAAYQVMNTLT